MQVSRRKFLASVGAGAILAAAPSGSIGIGAAQASAAASIGPGQFAVVSKHATWGIYETLAEAHREAELIRHSGAIMTNAVRCSPDMARQYQMGNLSGFVELDGWALTQDEARSKAIDMLRRAKDREGVRSQLLEHQLKDVRKRVAFKRLDDGDFEQDDAIARLAERGFVDRKDPAQLAGPSNLHYVAVTDESLWVLGTGRTVEEAHSAAAMPQRYFEDEKIVVLKASQTMARSVSANGYEVPLLWKLDRDIAVHEAEFAAISPA